ncbi:MAG: branched-chain amino acid ABC transporter permease [Thaumarchaeota archaeon]|nr:branched-chain amino acid ABC transporter permease [Nitrososphaerota archaeon]
MLPFLDVLIEGLLVGGIYALAALGISLIFSVMRILNLAHGNFIMLGAVLTFFVFNLLGGPALGVLGLVGTLVVGLVIFAGLGAAFDFVLIRPILRNSSNILTSAILVTIGLALVLQDLASYIVVRIPANIARSTTISLNVPSIGSVVIGGYYLSSPKLISLAVIAAAGIGLYFFFKRTYLGMAMRSISQDREAAVVVGVSLRRISLITFALGTLFAGFAGFILVIDQTADPALGLGYTIKLLTIMVLGGVRTPLGPVIGGLLLGLMEFSVAAVFGAYWISAVSLVILISILLVKPTGLTGGLAGV